MLVVGDTYIEDADALAERYWPDTDTWELTPPIPGWRSGLHLLGLNDGRVLAIGGRATPGEPIDQGAVYGPDQDLWEAVPSPDTTLQGAPVDAVRLEDGRVMVTGDSAGVDAPGMVAWIADPETWSWEAIPRTPEIAASHAITLAPNGQAFALGTRVLDGVWTGHAALSDPGPRVWAGTPMGPTPPSEISAVRLCDRSVLVLRWDGTARRLSWPTSSAP